MAQLPVISGARVVRAFEKAGWRQDRQRGSHVVMLKPECNVSLSVPQHREIAPGTLRALIRSAGITVDEFVALL
ncbi:MAG: type II toxin-antitoxin system HicA family toxin [Phycisphaerales bacterium]|nr:MAG: type II toxin-antitoxin system HicA family toxin [Phycisphaerales bacterium]